MPIQQLTVESSHEHIPDRHRGRVDLMIPWDIDIFDYRALFLQARYCSLQVTPYVPVYSIETQVRATGNTRSSDIGVAIECNRLFGQRERVRVIGTLGDVQETPTILDRSG